MPRMPITLYCVIIFYAVVLAGVGRLADAADQKGSRAERFQSITGDYEKKYTAYSQAFESAKTDAERAQAEKRKPSDMEFGKQLLAFAKEAPGDAIGFDTLVWMFENLDSADSAAQRDEAVGLFEKHYLKSPRLKAALSALAKCNSLKAESFLEKLGEQGASRDIRGLALYRLALGRYGRFDGKNDQQLAAIQTLLERVRKDYGNIQPDDEDKPLAKLAEGTLFEIRYLRPGKAAPDLAGTDVAGKPLKLSSFKGQVVMLVFWGSWCGPCMAKVPFERKLMEKYSGRRFTVVGINCGDDKNKAAAAIKQQKMTWPSFFDGDEGPIVTQWNISSFPTVFLIDTKGVIRLRDQPDDSELIKAIEAAVSEAEGK